MIPTLDRMHYRTASPQPRPGPDDPPTPCSLAPDAWVDPDREAEAMAGCRACPILRGCHAWILGLTAPQDAGGVVAAMTAKTRSSIRHSERALPCTSGAAARRAAPMSEPVDERDVRLAARLPAAADIICLVRDLDPDGVADWCARHGITDPAVQELIVLLAAMVPTDQPIDDLLAWTWTASPPRTACVVPMRRRCSCCGLELSLARFYRDRSKPLQRSYRCIDCTRVYRENGACEHQAGRRDTG